MSELREATVQIEIYADILCPWSYIAKRRLDKAFTQLRGAHVEIVWRSFELEPDLGRLPSQSAAQTIRDSRGDEADARIDRIVTLGALEGLTLDLERARPVNTFDAHRLVHLGAGVGKADATMERLLRAYHSEGENVADHDVLLRLASAAGLDTEEVRSTLAGERFADAVRSDERLARERGITGVPMMLTAGASPISAVLPVAELHAWLELALGRDCITKLRDLTQPSSDTK